MPPVIDGKLCNFCGTCYDICPQDVFSFDRKRKRAPVVAYPGECWYCGACVVDCPRRAVSLTLPLPLHIVPSPALYGPPGPEEDEALRLAADFSRSIEGVPERDPPATGKRKSRGGSGAGKTAGSSHEAEGRR
jgi:adenylylsulfate reductase subunit B